MHALPDDEQPTLTVDLLPHQRAGVEWLKPRPHALLADEVGLGKTITVLGLLGALGRAALPVLAVTEAGLVSQWVAEVEEKTLGLSVLSTDDPRWKRATRKAQTAYLRDFPEGPDITVTSYSSLPGQLESLFGPYGLIVLDEVSSIKGGGALFSAVQDIAVCGNRVIGATATPVENDYLETFTILQAVRTPDLWPRRVFEENFINRGRDKKANWYPKPGLKPGSREPFQSYVHQNVVRRTAEQLDIRMPERVGRLDPVWVTPTSAQREGYNRATYRPGLSGIATRQQVARYHKEESAMIDALPGLVAHLPDTEKFIVYAENVALVRTVIPEALAEVGIHSVHLDGGDNMHARDQALDAFRNDPGIRCLVGTQVLENGLNLQHCRVLVSLDTSWNPARERQREGRICRIGSPHDTYEHIVVVADTPDNRGKVRTLDVKDAQLRIFEAS